MVPNSHDPSSAGSSLVAAASEGDRSTQEGQLSPVPSASEHLLGGSHSQTGDNGQAHDHEGGVSREGRGGQGGTGGSTRCGASSSRGGSDTQQSIPVPVRRTYLDEVPEDLKCPICFDSAVSCRTPCSHFFCYTCINSHINNRLRQQQAVNCPLCRTAVSATNLMSIGGAKVVRVRALRVMCVGAVSGCTVSGTLEQVEKHESVCPHVLVFCRFRDRGCIAPLIRREAPLHENRCRFNPLVHACRHNLSGCKVRGTDELLRLHESRCRYRNMEKFVRCPHFESAGCGLLIKKKYRERHAQCCAFKIVQDAEQASRPCASSEAAAPTDAACGGAASAREAKRRRSISAAEDKEENREHGEARRADDAVCAAEGERKKLRGAPDARDAQEEDECGEDEADRRRGAEETKADLHSFRISFEWRNADKAISYEDLQGQLRAFLPNVVSVQGGRTFGEFHAIVERVPVTVLRAVGMAGDPQVSCSLFDLNLRLKGITTVQAGIE